MIILVNIMRIVKILYKDLKLNMKIKLRLGFKRDGFNLLLRLNLTNYIRISIVRGRKGFFRIWHARSKCTRILFLLLKMR